eukprot:scaffold12315_cov14-Tisochrysis_lutea.AAC.1
MPECICTLHEQTWLQASHDGSCHRRSQVEGCLAVAATGAAAAVVDHLDIPASFALVRLALLPTPAFHYVAAP